LQDAIFNQHPAAFQDRHGWWKQGGFHQIDSGQMPDQEQQGKARDIATNGGQAINAHRGSRHE
jgi:hypothetical protein